MPINAPATMPNATSTMSVTSVARSGMPMRLTACAIRRVGPTSVRTSPRCTRVAGKIGTGVPARMICRRKTLRTTSSPRELGERAAVDFWRGDDDVERLGRNVEKLASSTSRTPSFCSSIRATSRSRRPVIASVSPRCTTVVASGSRMPIRAPDPLDEQAGVARQCFELARLRPIERRSRLHGIGAALDVPPCHGRRRRARRCICCSYRRHSSSRLTPISRGASCARNQAAPTTPIR